MHMNIRKNYVFAVIVVAALLLPATADALSGQDQIPRSGTAPDTVTLTLSEVRRLAVTRNPAFLADAQESAIARGSLRQARLYQFNPELEAELPSASSDFAGTYQAQVSQTFELAGQRGARIDAAEFDLERADAAVRNAARSSIADATLAFYAALADQRRFTVSREILRLNSALIDAVRVQVREGEVSRLEGNLAELEVGRSQARVLAAERAFVAAQLALKLSLGIAPETPIALAGDVSMTPTLQPLRADSLIAMALERRPDLSARVAAVRQSQALIRLSRREAIPNVRAGAIVEREGGSGNPRIGLGFALPLPLWNRNQGLTAAREAEHSRAQFALAATELRVRTEVMAAHTSYVAAVEEARIYETSVLEPARENQQLLETAFRSGKIALPTLLLLRNQLLDAELGYWDTWLLRQRTLIELHAATGTILDEINNAER